MKQKIITGLAILLGASCAFGEVIVNFGYDTNNVDGGVPGSKWARSDVQVSDYMDSTSEASAYTTGSFSVLPSGNAGSGVTFDVVVTSSTDKWKAQLQGLGVNDNTSGDAAVNNDEWFTVSITNIIGIDPLKETILIESVGLKFTSDAESYILNDGTETYFTGTADVLAINSNTFKLQEGALTTSAFVISSLSFDVAAVPEPATLGLVALSGGAVLFIRRRIMM